MKLIIDIPYEAYYTFKCESEKGNPNLNALAEIIAKGTPNEARPQGEWVKDNSGDRFCSECGKSALYHEIGLLFESRFCPNCGAKMKGGAE